MKDIFRFAIKGFSYTSSNVGTLKLKDTKQKRTQFSFICTTFETPEPSIHTNSTITVISPRPSSDSVYLRQIAVSICFTLASVHKISPKELKLNVQRKNSGICFTNVTVKHSRTGDMGIGKIGVERVRRILSYVAEYRHDFPIHPSHDSVAIKWAQISKFEPNHTCNCS